MSEDGRYFGASIEHSEDGAEYYMAREVSAFLGYTKWRAFLTVLHRAMRICPDASVHTAMPTRNSTMAQTRSARR